MYFSYSGDAWVSCLYSLSVIVHTYGANSNGIQPIYNLPLAKGWILDCSMFLAHSLTVSVKLVSEQ